MRLMCNPEYPGLVRSHTYRCIFQPLHVRILDGAEFSPVVFLHHNTCNGVIVLYYLSIGRMYVFFVVVLAASGWRAVGILRGCVVVYIMPCSQDTLPGGFHVKCGIVSEGKQLGTCFPTGVCQSAAVSSFFNPRFAHAANAGNGKGRCTVLGCCRPTGNNQQHT